jgi:sucrose-6-phosphate hydrolase SacC (GH32 family)
MTVPEFPYLTTDYREPYRGQFHFSPPSGWMNDINGLWYLHGEYHLAFQHNPHAPENGLMHWGHATSPDLLHWTIQPIMLEPDVNVPGACWSGSTVVDVANDSGLRTGSNPVVLTFYTATRRGQCLACSNDLGATWQPYHHRATANGALLPGRETPRDPHVFRYRDSHWVLALYEQLANGSNGTAFYVSSDLRDWTRASEIAFGFECPDIFELPVDGNCADTRWVLQDASGRYIVGSFDGHAFTPDGNRPQHMDLGPDFYAAQTFFRGTFPDRRLVQIGWHCMWKRGLRTAPWRNHATFPATLALRSTPAGLRITRAPITELTRLHRDTQRWDAHVLRSGVNLLAGRAGKCFDLTVEFDVRGTSATAIAFQVADRTILYDLTGQTILGKPLPAVGDRVKIRILADWSLLEIFGQDGLFSWTENTHLAPESATVGLTANGDIRLLAAEFHRVERIW